jgi:hypothetical protein
VRLILGSVGVYSCFILAAGSALGWRLTGANLSYRRSALGPILSSFKESRSFGLELAPALDGCQLLRTGVGVEKLEISEISTNSGIENV